MQLWCLWRCRSPLPRHLLQEVEKFYSYNNFSVEVQLRTCTSPILEIWKYHVKFNFLVILFSVNFIQIALLALPVKVWLKSKIQVSVKTGGPGLKKSSKFFWKIVLVFQNLHVRLTGRRKQNTWLSKFIYISSSPG